MTPHGMVHWNEFLTHDIDKAKAFFNETLGWTFDAMPMPDGTQYFICISGGETVGGMYESSDPNFADAPDFWMTHFAVDDVDARVSKAKDKGGTVMREPFDIPGIGRVAIVRSPGGGVQGWITPADMA